MRTLPVFDSSERLPFLITIQRGLTTLRWTTASSDVAIDGETWTSEPGAIVTSLSYTSDGTPNNVDAEIQTYEGGPLEPGDGIRGILDGWPISVKMFDPADPEGTAVEMCPGATIGSVSEDTNGLARIAAEGQMILASAPVTEHFSLTCRHDLGDDGCKVPIMPADIGRGVVFVRADVSAPGLQHVNDCYGRMLTGSPSSYANVYYECTTAGTTDATTAPTYDPVVGHTTTDGTAVFTARNAWTRSATGEATGDFTIVLDALPDSRASDATWFVMGGLYIRSGVLNDYQKFPIRAWDPGTLTLTLFLPVAPADVPAGTQMEIHVGCDLTREMCHGRFDNIADMAAETFVPPPDVNVA